MEENVGMPKLDLPYGLQLEITDKCNLKCEMCVLAGEGRISGQQPGHMAEEVWKKVIDVARRLELVIMAGFGEPLVNPKCLDYLEELNALGVAIGFSTNGIALTHSASRRLSGLKRLKHINVSLDSPDPEVYRRIRGGDLEKALTGLKNLMSVIEAPQRVTVSSVLMDSNVATLASFPILLSRLGVKKYMLQDLVNYNLKEMGNHLCHGEASLYLERIKTACEKAGVELLFTAPDRPVMELSKPSKSRDKNGKDDLSPQRETRQCCVPWEIPFIDRNGKVFPCCYAASRQEGVLGDLRESDFASIWQGASYRQFRERLFRGHPMPAVCQGCTVAPLGEHPLSRYSGKILVEKSVLVDQKEICLTVQNTGTSSWKQDSSIRIGTINPRDHASAYFHVTWLKPHRIGTFSETAVPPGETATFKFRIRPNSKVASEAFQLVVDGTTWMPHTQFEIRPGRARDSLSYRVGSRAMRLASRFLGDDVSTKMNCVAGRFILFVNKQRRR